MITVGRNTGKQPFYNMGTYVCDYESDVASLPTNKSAGSIAKVIASGNVYILNAHGVWVLQPETGGSSSGSSGGGNTDTLPDTDVTIRYDGGEILPDTNTTIRYDGGVVS